MQRLLAHGGIETTINALPKHQETVDEYIRQTYSLRSLRHSGVINSTMLLICMYLFQCSLFSPEIFECAKITTGGHTKNSVSLQ